MRSRPSSSTWRVDGVEEGGGGGRGAEAEREAELAVEVAATERGVVAVGQAEAGRGSRWRSARSTQVLPTPGSPMSSDAGALGERLDEPVDERLPWTAGSHRSCVGDLLGEGRAASGRSAAS